MSEKVTLCSIPSVMQLCALACTLELVVYLLPLRRLSFALFRGVLRKPLLVWWYLFNNYYNAGITWYDHACKVTLSSIPPVHSHFQAAVICAAICVTQGRRHMC